MSDAADDSRADDEPAVNSDADLAAANVGARDESALSAATVTINRPAREIYDFWRNQRNLVPIMDNVRSITPAGEGRWHWVVEAPGGRTVEWDAVITEDRPGSLLAWESAEGADIRNSGRIAFEDAPGRGSYVTATIAYDPPLGAIGKLFAKLFQREPAIQSRRDLRRLKQFLETGEIATSSRTRAQLEEERN